MSESEPGLMGEEGRVTGGSAADNGYDYNNINTINNIQTEDIMNLFDDYQINPLDVLDVQVSTKEDEEGGGESSTVNLEEKLSNIKDLCLRSDLSAVVKIDKILKIVDPSIQQEVLPVPNTETKVLGGKRPADMKGRPSASPSKFPKLDPEKNKANVSSQLNFNDESCACVVCGLSLKVFRNDANKELIHYLR